MNNEAYTELRQFFAGYFHQFWKQVIDWKGKEPNFEGIVRLYLKETSPENVERTSQLLEELVNKRLDEEELSDVIFRGLGAWIRPAGFGMTNQEWLETVLNILKEKNIGDSPERIHY